MAGAQQPPATPPGITQPAPAGQTPAQPPAADAAGPGPLTLEEVFRTVDAGFPRLLAADADRRAAVARRRQAQGAFDINTSIGTEFQRYNTSSSRGTEYTYTSNPATIGMTMRSGLEVYAGRDFNAGVVKSPASSTGNSGTFFAGIRLPLLRGWRVNPAAVDERQAVLGIPLADRNYEAVRLSALLSAAGAYWDWVAAGQKRAVAAELLRLGELRAAQIRTEARLGSQPTISVTEADQEVQRRRGALVAAEREVQRAGFDLAVFLWNPDGTPGAVPRPDAAPAAMPTPAPLPADVVAEARERAVTNRPEVGAVRLRQEITNLDVRLAENDTRPDLSLVAQPGQDLGRRGIGDTMKMGLSFSVPLNRWEATGRRDAAKAQAARLDQERELLLRQVALEVDDAASAVNTAEERYRAAAEEVQLAVVREEGERKKFAAGDSTLFLVNQFERATAEARGRLIEAMAQFQQATAAFRAASAQF